MSQSDTSFVISLDGEEILVDPLDIDGNEWHTIKQQTGLPAKKVMEGTEELDFDCLAAVVWIHVRRDRPDVAFDEVLSGLSLRSLTDGMAGDGADPSSSEGGSEGDLGG